MSYAPEVSTDSTGKFYRNALRFASHEEATAYVIDLSMRWTAVRDVNVAQTEDPVTHKIVDGLIEPVQEQTS